MTRITGLLIDPHTETSQVIRFEPSLEELCRLIDTQRIDGFSDDDRRLTYTYMDEAPEDLGDIVYCKGWASTVRGKVIITGLVDGEGEHTSLTPDKIEECRAIHYVGNRLPAGGFSVIYPLNHNGPTD